MSFKVIVSVTHDIDIERIRGLLCCGFEGGVGYWCQIIDYTFPDGVKYDDFREGGKRQDPENYWHPCQLVPTTNGCAVICNIDAGEGLSEEEEKQNEEGLRLDLEAIGRGLKIMANKYPHHFADFIQENDDATTGDVFIQCCLLGEIVYG